jgi:Fe2+ transport system protein FeoA
MGISRGAEIVMIRNHKRLPLIVEVRETFLAMGRGEAEKIRVSRNRQ